MADRPPDEAFGQHLLKAGFVTEAELRSALQAQAETAAKGAPLPLGDILVQQGVLTPVMREKAEKKLESQREDAKRLGPYRILKKLGEGGMGAVYLAEDADQKKIALKVLPKVAAREEDAVRRFLREVDSARKLDHPNIVRAGAAGEDRGFHYYVMEYVEGETLGGRLKREEFLSPDEAAKVVLQIAHGLKYAHEQGYIHRDIKPDNVVVSKEGVAKILDMGLSKNIDEAQSFRTVTGVALGTPHYIAPEQARGDKGIDGRADIYSLGATYYHLVTGETPFHGTTVIELINAHLNKQLPDPQDLRDGIPDGVVHILRRMMAKKPGDRYRDCSELVTDLELVLGGRNPASQALEAAQSAVALPMAREARERFRAQRRGQRPGTYRATTRSKSSSAPLVVGGVVAAVVVVIVLVVAMSGGGTKPIEPSAVTVKETRPEVPKPREPESRPAEPAPRAMTREELRSEEAQRKLDGFEAVKKSGQFADDEIRRRYAEFAKDYADTAQGKTISAWLKSKEPKPPEPAIAEVKPEPPKIADNSKPPEPPKPAPPEVKPPEPLPADPVVKPPRREAPSAGPRPAIAPADAMQFNGHYYKLFPEAGTWHAAKKRCEEMGGHLVTISNAEEDAFVRDTFKLDRTAWIGLSDEDRDGGWTWVTGEPLSFTSWASGQPARASTSEEPFAGFNTDLKWHDFHVRMTLFTFICEWEPTGKLARPAIPDATKLREAEAAVRKAFPINQAKTAKDKVDLARALLSTAATSGAKDAELYVLLREARDLAAKAGNRPTALGAVDAMAASFEIDPLLERLGVLSLLGKAITDAASATLLIDDYRRLISDAIRSDEYEIAADAGKAALTVAKLKKDEELVARLQERLQDASVLAKEFPRVQTAEQRLKQAADDVAANLTVGRFRCLWKGDWESGLPFLARGSDAVLKVLAGAEIQAPEDAPSRLRLADGWYALAEKERMPLRKENLATRAIHWYSSAGKLVQTEQLRVSRSILALHDDKSIRVGPVGLWNLDDARGTIARDSSKYGNHGSLMGTVTWAKGKLGGGASFNGPGSGSYIRIPHHWVLDPAEFSIALWLRAESIVNTGDVGIISLTSAYGQNSTVVAHSFALMTEPDAGIGGSLNVGEEAGHLARSAPNALKPGVWQHAALTYDGYILKVFLDGTLVASKSVGKPRGPSAHDFLIGGGLNSINGQLDDVRFYNRPLGDAEVVALYRIPDMASRK